jgi:serine/threonine protein kinase
MNEQYKEPEALEFSPHDEEAAPDRTKVKEPSDRTPDLVESNNRSARLSVPLKDDPNDGTLLNGRYRLLSMIGNGATSAVYKAEDTKLNKTVAIKMLHSHLAYDVTIMRRFEQEAKTASLLSHPNIVDIQSYEKAENGIPYLVMDLVQGTSLQDAIKAAGWLPAERTIAIFLQVCAALAAAHEKGIVHRDLKPSNIMLTEGPDGKLLVKVLDFGVAKILGATGDTVLKLTQTGEMLGSILYMSPEQCLDKELDGRSDCYSVGCVMYETLTGKPPLAARTAFETMNKHMTEMPERLDRVRPDLQWADGLQNIIFKAMAKDPNQRYQTITALQDDLRRAVLVSRFDRREEVQAIGHSPMGRSEISASGRDLVANETTVEPIPNVFDRLEKFLRKRFPDIFEGIILTMLAIFALSIFVSVARIATGSFWWDLLLWLPMLVGGYLFLRSMYLNSEDESIRSKYLNPNGESLSKPRNFVAAAERIRVQISHIYTGRNNERDYFDLYIPPTSKQEFKVLRVEPMDDNKITMWRNLSDASEVGSDKFPVNADVYVDARGQAIVVKVRGALARVVE